MTDTNAQRLRALRAHLAIAEALCTELLDNEDDLNTVQAVCVDRARHAAVTAERCLRPVRMS